MIRLQINRGGISVQLDHGLTSHFRLPKFMHLQVLKEVCFLDRRLSLLAVSIHILASHTYLVKYASYCVAESSKICLNKYDLFGTEFHHGFSISCILSFTMTFLP